MPKSVVEEHQDNISAQQLWTSVKYIMCSCVNHFSTDVMLAQSVGIISWGESALLIKQNKTRLCCVGWAVKMYIDQIEKSS